MRLVIIILLFVFPQSQDRYLDQALRKYIGYKPSQVDVREVAPTLRKIYPDFIAVVATRDHKALYPFYTLENGQLTSLVFVMNQQEGKYLFEALELRERDITRVAKLTLNW